MTAPNRHPIRRPPPPRPPTPEETAARLTMGSPTNRPSTYDVPRAPSPCERRRYRTIRDLDLILLAARIHPTRTAHARSRTHAIAVIAHAEREGHWTTEIAGRTLTAERAARPSVAPEARHLQYRDVSQ